MVGEMGKKPKGRILVLGVGNLLMGDEGVGIHAVRELSKRTLPSYVDTLDGGTAGLDLLPLMRGYEMVLIIDAVDAGQEPGAILRFTPQDIRSDNGDLVLSLHQAEIVRVMEFASYVGQALPPIIIYGIQPESLDWSTELSATVRAQLDALVSAVQEEVSKIARQ